MTLGYDLLLVAINIVWLVRETSEGGVPWEKPTLVEVYAVAFTFLPFGTELHVPIAPLAVVAILAL